MPATAPTPAALLEALGTAGGVLDEAGRRIAIATYRLLTHGNPVTHTEIAAAADASLDEVTERFAEWAGVFQNRDGAIVGFWGLALDPLDPEYHLADTEGGTVGYAWCAWDTLFLPTVLGRRLDVRARDGLTGDAIALTVSPEGADAVVPEGTVVSFLAPEGPWEADIITSFCHKVIFFADQDNADRWIAEQPDRLFTLSVGEAFEVGRQWTADRYGDTLD